MIHFLHRMVQKDPSVKLATWLFRIATHLALNWIRDGRNEKSQTSLDRETTDGAGRQVADRGRTIEQEFAAPGEAVGGAAGDSGLAGQATVAVMMHKYEEMVYAEMQA